jgi:MYXO-CTERM domain-containing protein
VRPYFERPDSSLAEDPAGTDPIRYGASIFFEHIDEHADRKALRRMFELIADTGDDWPVALDLALREQNSSIAEQFASFVEWNLFTADRADPKRAYARGDQLPKLKEREIEPGFSDDGVRVFPLAARYYALRTSAADSVRAKASLPDDTGLDDLQLTIAVERAGEITSVEHAEPQRLRELEVQLEAGDTAHIILYNTANAGGSVRPDLCIATKSTQDTCAKKTQPEADAGSEPSPAKKDSGCAVQTPGAPTQALWWLSLGAVLRAALRRRRRS